MRTGLATIDGIGHDTAEAIVRERENRGPFADIYDLSRRVGLREKQLEALSGAGALDDLGINRRQALWLSGSAATARPDYLEGTHSHIDTPLFAPMSDREIMSADRLSTGISPGDHPLAHLRGWLHDQGVCSSVDLRSHDTTRRVWLAGLVTHRQRPATAGGVTFLNLEDEWGLVNVVCSQGLWKRYRLILRHSGALIVRGTLQRSSEGVMSVVADGVSQLAVGAAVRARNFQ